MAYEDLAPNYAIEIEGSELGTGITDFVEKVEYESADGMADMARITVNDPDFALSNLKAFRPGNEMDIYMGYGTELEHIGRVVLRRQKFHFPAEGMPTFNVMGYTLDAKMMDNSPEEGKKRRFPDMKYSDIVMEVASAYGFAGIDIDDTPDEPKSARSRWQKAGVTDYQVIQALSNITGFYFWVDYLPDEGGWTIHFKDPAKVLDSVQQPDYHFKYNDGDLTTLIEFHPELVLQGVTTKLKIVFKDPKTGKRVVEEIEEENESEDIKFAGDDTAEAEEELGPPTTIKVFFQDYSFELEPKRFADAADAKAWAQQWFRRNRENFILGNGLVIGVEGLRARQFHLLSGLNKSLDGKYYFSKVRHVLSTGEGYMCSFSARKQDSLT